MTRRRAIVAGGPSASRALSLRRVDRSGVFEPKGPRFERVCGENPNHAQ